ncbi:NADH dehydrogenase [Treponema primitia ZAS-2]|nr:NADH-ubiquinone oxidoreductase-F iron-sulfur binding region domain-containing protein [Treponema primitia]AEF85018.1 NADH dehydrogenase [Treponema primitia ZAS-2]
MPELKDREELQQMRAKYERSFQAEQKKIIVCAGTGCVSAGSLEIYQRLINLLEGRNMPCAVELKNEPEAGLTGIKRSGCHGFCEMGPLVLIEPEGCLYLKVKLEDCEEIIEKTIVKNEIIDRLVYTKDGKLYSKRLDIPFYKKQKRLALEHCGQINALSIKEYLAIGGYRAFEKALFEMSADDIVQVISESNLRGRGGAGFPTGRKWAEAKRQRAIPKYIICNGDEGDPGAFMDRSVMEGDPHRMIEGMMIGALACGASEGYIYVRAEYPLAVSRLGIAIEQAKKLGLLGEHILGSDFNFNLTISRGAGAFVCGEGSALISSIEGKRGMPRVKPPRTAEHGLFNQPTVLNNVETFAAVPLIIEQGAAWYKSIGPETSPGTKAFALTGNIANTGLIEVPMGIKLRDIVFDVGGGIPGGGEFKAVQVGGPSGGCLTAEHLDLPMDFDSLKKAGAMIGSGGLVVMDEKTCMVEIARYFMNFTQNESCGKCIPCREGTKLMLGILERIVAGEGRAGDIERLLELADTISSTALCGLGKTAPSPVISTIRYFRAEYEAHINEKHCPAGACQKLKKLFVDDQLCIGCTKCVKACPVGAISGEKKVAHTIDSAKCIKCGACVGGCPKKAIKTAA